MSFCIQQLAEEVRLSGLLSDGRHCISEYMLPKIQTTTKVNTYIVRVLVYVSFPFVRSDYVISTGVGFRVASGVVASP